MQTFSGIVDLFLSQLVGFVLWLVVTPLRLVAALLDPVLGGLWGFIDVSGFLAQIEVLRGFFTDVNYFIPFAAMVAMVRLTLQVMFLVTCARAAEVTAGFEFVSLANQVFHFMLDKAVNTVQRILEAVLGFFIPSGIFTLGS